MLKDYPATQLFLLSLVVLMVLIFITPLVKEWHIFAEVIDSLQFIVKIICGFFLFCIVVIDGVFSRKHKHVAK
ncbi:hypothetical protein [Sporomusa malonica]|uniref:Uncharacterized protein n=1 Tax=Sporomusa malonica TaxID=112901 RepID=A0A1W2EHH1_9FIRM|nr:hypothetical protein [Sporomusa malonica]SMD08786.1 hypothetical protein SAMN04488500_12411 [Sporomusa malonica]